jgi:hypothetical protein
MRGRLRAGAHRRRPPPAGGRQVRWAKGRACTGQPRGRLVTAPQWPGAAAGPRCGAAARGDQGKGLPCSPLRGPPSWAQRRARRRLGCPGAALLRGVRLQGGPANLRAAQTCRRCGADRPRRGQRPGGAGGGVGWGGAGGPEGGVGWGWGRHQQPRRRQQPRAAPGGSRRQGAQGWRRRGASWGGVGFGAGPARPGPPKLLSQTQPCTPSPKGSPAPGSARRAQTPCRPSQRWMIGSGTPGEGWGGWGLGGGPGSRVYTAPIDHARAPTPTPTPTPNPNPIPNPNPAPHRRVDVVLIELDAVLLSLAAGDVARVRERILVGRGRGAWPGARPGARRRRSVAVRGRGAARRAHSAAGGEAAVGPRSASPLTH